MVTHTERIRETAVFHQYLIFEKAVVTSEPAQLQGKQENSELWFITFRLKKRSGLLPLLGMVLRKYGGIGLPALKRETRIKG